MKDPRSTISIVLNGETRTVESGTAIPDLLRIENIDPSATGMAVAVNDAVIRRQRWEHTEVSEGDRVEIVTANQGG